MNRYRTYAQEDDQSLEEGDKFFVGVNQFDIAENLAPGQVQAATNMDFTDATAKTRGGFIGLPQTSPNNPIWIAGTAPNTQGWYAATFCNGKFVAVGVASGGTANRRASYSSDGISWTLAVTPAENNWTAVAYGAGLFVATAYSGAGNRVMTSPDGITWTIRTSAGDFSWYNVVYGNGVFAAISGDSSSNNVMYSSNGISWTLADTSISGTFLGAAYGNGVFVAVGTTSPYVMTSRDGVSWTQQTAAGAYNWNSVAFGNGLFVATSGNNGFAMTSVDGIAWTLVTLPVGMNVLTGIYFGNNSFYASDYSGAKTWISADGNSWKSSAAIMSGLQGIMVYGDDKIVALQLSASTSFQYAYSPIANASSIYSDPSSTATPWIVEAGSQNAFFYSFGQTSRRVPYPSGTYVSSQSTIVQANNFLYIFPGIGQTPLRWDGAWGGSFIAAPASTLGAGFQNIPQSNQATYYQNRLWVVNGKDTESASQNLDFQNFNVLAAAFNLNVGTSDYLIASYPFGDNSLVVFKKNSVYLLQNVDGALTDVTSTEITRQLGITGINACVSVGPDIVFMTDRNITTVRLSIQNALQAVTIPLSQNINPIIRRVNWAVANKISMGYSNNLLFVALPLDNATVCSTIVVYNFITQQWYGEWSFASSINMAVQGFVRANYLGQIRLHVITEDGRIFVTDQGQNDISGAVVAEISTSLTTRAYRLDNNSHIPRRMYMDLGTNRPNFTATAYAEGASESSTILSGQTYSRANSWLFNDSTYTLTNANDDYNRAFRQDYSTGPNSIRCGTGFQPEMTQDYRFPIITRRKGRLSWFKVSNTTGFIRVNGVGIEARPGDRSSFVQVG